MKPKQNQLWNISHYKCQFKSIAVCKLWLFFIFFYNFVGILNGSRPDGYAPWQAFLGKIHLVPRAEPYVLQHLAQSNSQINSIIRVSIAFLFLSRKPQSWPKPECQGLSEDFIFSAAHPENDTPFHKNTFKTTQCRSRFLQGPTGGKPTPCCENNERLMCSTFICVS